MGFAVVHFFPGGTQEQYERMLEAVHPAGGLPEGQTYHAAGPSEGGWTVLVVHDSKGSWERFRNTILMPRIQQGVEGGFTSPPQERTFEVYNPTK